MKFFPALLVAASILFVSGCASHRPARGTTPQQHWMEVTGYCDCKKCCGWERNWYGRPIYAYGSLKGKRKKVGYTSTGVKAGKGTIAADPKRYRMGTTMHIKGYGYGTVEDVGGAIKGNRIDLFFKSHKEALRWGRKKMMVTVWR